MNLFWKSHWPLPIIFPKIKKKKRRRRTFSYSYQPRFQKTPMFYNSPLSFVFSENTIFNLETFIDSVIILRHFHLHFLSLFRHHNFINFTISFTVVFFLIYQGDPTGVASRETLLANPGGGGVPGMFSTCARKPPSPMRRNPPLPAAGIVVINWIVNS